MRRRRFMICCVLVVALAACSASFAGRSSWTADALCSAASGATMRSEGWKRTCGWTATGRPETACSPGASGSTGPSTG